MSASEVVADFSNEVPKDTSAKVDDLKRKAENGRTENGVSNGKVEPEVKKVKSDAIDDTAGDKPDMNGDKEDVEVVCEEPVKDKDAENEESSEKEVTEDDENPVECEKDEKTDQPEDEVDKSTAEADNVETAVKESE